MLDEGLNEHSEIIRFGEVARASIDCIGGTDIFFTLDHGSMHATKWHIAYIAL